MRDRNSFTKVSFPSLEGIWLLFPGQREGANSNLVVPVIWKGGSVNGLKDFLCVSGPLEQVRDEAIYLLIKFLLMPFFSGVGDSALNLWLLIS